MRRCLLTVGVLMLTLATGLSAEPPAGYTALFNGKDLTGWKVYRGKPGSWAVEDGVLYVKGGGGWLMTEKEYSDFELTLEFRVPTRGNSGVALRSPLMGDPAYTGMEIQILDDPNYKGLKDFQHTGSIYGVVAAAKIANKPIGEWNRYRIVCKGPQVTVELNGEKLVDANLNDHKEKHAKAHPGILRTSGHIGFQEHGGRVEFRNVYIKELR